MPSFSGLGKTVSLKAQIWQGKEMYFNSTVIKSSSFRKKKKQQQQQKTPS